MAFVDFHAAGEAPASVRDTPRGWRQQRRRRLRRNWRVPLLIAVALPTLAITAHLATHLFDDALLGALSAALLYAVGAPVMARLLDTGASYQRMTRPTHRRG